MQMNLQLALSDGRGGLGSRSKTLHEAEEQCRAHTAASKPQASRPLACCTALGKLRDPLCLSFLIFKMGLIIVLNT